MNRLGLDVKNSDDYALLAFIIRGFHLRYFTWKRGGPKNDLGVYLYNLDGVRSGQPIPILDASPLEGIKAQQLGEMAACGGCSHTACPSMSPPASGRVKVCDAPGRRSCL